MDNNDKDKQTTDAGPGPAPGESNARAGRNTSVSGAAGSGSASGTATHRESTQNVDTKRVRMTRDDGTRRSGEVIDLPADEARRLIESGAASEV